MGPQLWNPLSYHVPHHHEAADPMEKWNGPWKTDLQGQWGNSGPGPKAGSPEAPHASNKRYSFSHSQEIKGCKRDSDWPMGTHDPPSDRPMGTTCFLFPSPQVLMARKVCFQRGLALLPVETTNFHWTGSSDFLWLLWASKTIKPTG